MVFSMIGKIVVLAILVVVGIFYFTGIDISPGDSIEKVEEVVGEEVFIPESAESAKARQIKTLYERVTPDNLGDLAHTDKCEINLDKEKIKSNENVGASYVFSEDLVGETVKLACDQFERFGISGDELLTTSVSSTTSVGENINCDYGSVTRETVYYWFVSSEDLSEDYCISPLIVIPEDGDVDECFSDDVIQNMKDECESDGKPYFEIPDSAGCNTVYCGGNQFSQCPSETLLESAIEECESVENQKAVRYSYDVAGQDFPCADVKCSVCPSEAELESEKESCSEQGGEPVVETDFETLCNFVVCGSGEGPPA